MRAFSRAPTAPVLGQVHLNWLPHPPTHPTGFKEKNRTTTTYDRAEIVPCIKGEVSYWSGSTRYPVGKPEECLGCAANTYAPRTGMAACLPCRAGTYPTKTVGTLPGNDACAACSGNTYRPSSSTRCAADAGH